MKYPRIVRHFNYKVQIERKPTSDAINVWLIQYDQTQAYNLNTDGETYKTTLIKEGDDFNVHKPFLCIPGVAWEAIAKAIAEEAPKDKDVVDAELKATKTHLRDLQRIVFKRYKKVVRPIKFQEVKVKEDVQR